MPTPISPESLAEFTQPMDPSLGSNHRPDPAAPSCTARRTQPGQGQGRRRPRLPERSRRGRAPVRLHPSRPGGDRRPRHRRARSRSAATTRCRTASGCTRRVCRSSRSRRRWTTTSTAPTTASDSRPPSPVGFSSSPTCARSTGSHERIAVVELFGRYSGETSLITAYLAARRSGGHLRSSRRHRPTRRRS